MRPADRSTSPADHSKLSSPAAEGFSRRHWLAAAGAATAGLAALSRSSGAAESAAGAGSAAGGSATTAPSASSAPGKIKNGRINQSVCHWCFDPMPMATLAEASKAMGIKSVEIVPIKEFDLLKRNGLICAMTPSHTFVRGLNQVANHPECLAKLRESIEATGDAGFPNVITFSGMRQGLTDEEGIKNTVAGLKQVIGLAEKKKVNLCIEVLNSRVATHMKGHPDYQCDKVDWAAQVCHQVASPNMKILFDIYHVQIMEGDIITRIHQYKDMIAHYHTAGNPGRNDLDDTQEINYPPIMRAILETGYTGYVGQEFIPKGPDKLAALWQGVELCDV